MELNKLDGSLEILVDYSETPTITLRGEVDYRNMERVKHTISSLIDRGKTSISVDLTDLVFMDSTGISALIDAAKAITSQSGEVKLVSPSTQLTKVLEKSGFNEIFKLGQTEPQDRNAVCNIKQDTRDAVAFEVPGRPEMIAHIRSRVAEFACSMPFTGEEIEDIKLAVGEASTNALKHGANPSWCKVGIQLEKGKDYIKISITDKGCGFNPESVKPTAPGAIIEGGRGILFMRALMDEVAFHQENPGTRVELTKRYHSMLT